MKSFYEINLFLFVLSIVVCFSIAGLAKLVKFKKDSTLILEILFTIYNHLFILSAVCLPVSYLLNYFMGK